jgi:hypothetical protein
MKNLSLDQMPEPGRSRRGKRRLLVLLLCAAFTVAAFSCCYAVLTTLSAFSEAITVILVAAAFISAFALAMAWALSTDGTVALFIVLAWLLYTGEVKPSFTGLLQLCGAW